MSEAHDEPGYGVEDGDGLTLERVRILEAALRRDGYGAMIAWSEALQPPTDAAVFAHEVIYVICNSGMSVVVAGQIYRRCLDALDRGHSATAVFRHAGKAAAIDAIWQQRDALFAAYRAAEDKLDFCAALPWIGPVTKHHLAKNLGLDTVKPDVHLARLAQREGITAMELCQRLAAQTGYRAATIDTILWRACADSVLDPAAYLAKGWKAALRANGVR